MKSRLAFGIGLWFCAASFASALEEPRLSITNVSGEFVVSWPASATDWVLDHSPHLRPPVPWTGVSPHLYQSDGAFRFVTVSALDGNRFYRLRKGVGMPAISVPGLTGHWQLDEGAGQSSADGTGAGTAMLFSNTTWSSGRFGPGGLRFNGAGAGAGGSRAWVSNSNHRVLPPSGQPFSVSVWLNPDALTLGWRGVMGNDATGSNGWRVALNSPGPGTNFLVFAAPGMENSLSVTGQMLLLPNQWRQLTVTHDGAVGSIYLDSALLARGAGGLLTHSGPIYFGGGVGNLDSFLGRLDDIRVYTNCLTHEEISLSGQWRFDEGAGGFALDSSIRGHYASVTGTAAWVTGRSGAAIDLSTNQVLIRNEDYAVLPASGGAFSLSFWLRPDSMPPGRSGLMNCGEGTNSGWRLIVDTEVSGKTWLAFESTNSGGTLDLRAPLALTNGVWTKLDVTFNGGIATAYANGRKVGSRFGAIRGSRSPLTLGAGSALDGFAGAMDDLKIYNRERGETEVGPVARTLWETVLLNSVTNLPLQGFGPPGKPLTYTIRSIISPTNGTVGLLPGSSSATFSAGSRKGPDAFVYEVSDGEFTSDPAIVVLSVVEPHWLSPNGGFGDPLDGKSPVRAWVAGSANALDAIWKTNNYYDCFFYAPGTYETRGWKDGQRSTANPGCKHVGSGSSGPNETRLRLVDILAARSEERIFSSGLEYTYCDNFEVHRMALDCNAPNLPKFIRGEPVWVRLPLTTTGRVDSVTLHWSQATMFGIWQFGGAAEIELCAENSSGNTTNCAAFAGASPTEVLPVSVEAEELVLQFNRRWEGVDFYSLAEVQVSGGTISLPSATVAGGTERSQLDVEYPIVRAVDNNVETSWASGLESQVQITLPLARGTQMSQIILNWNCKTVAGIGRFGPAASFSLKARDEITGQIRDLSIVRHGRPASGLETITLGTPGATNPVVTDQLILLLTAREASVDYYSLREVTVQNGASPVAFRLPAALGALSPSFDILGAFDDSPDTVWTSPTQGSVTAIAVQGNNLKYTGLKITGFGTKAARECFPLFYGGFYQPEGPVQLGNVLIEDCTFGDPVGINPDGLSTVTVSASNPNTLTNAVVRRCTVKGVKSHFTYSHGLFAPLVENCVVDDCQVAVYSEPDSSNVDDLGAILVRSNRFVNVDLGVYLQSHAAAQFDSVVCLENDIALAATGGGWGVAFCDICDPGPSGSTTNVVVLNNIIRYPDWGARPARPEGGVYYTDIHHGVVGNNLVALGSQNSLRIRNCPAGFIPPKDPKEDCDHPGPYPPGNPTYPPCLDSLPPGYRRAWFNNRNLSGGLLGVQFFNQGVMTNASQQQWPE